MQFKGIILTNDDNLKGKKITIATPPPYKKNPLTFRF